MAQLVSDVRIEHAVQPPARIHVRNELEVQTTRLCPP